MGWGAEGPFAFLQDPRTLRRIVPEVRDLLVLRIPIIILQSEIRTLAIQRRQIKTTVTIPLKLATTSDLPELREAGQRDERAEKITHRITGLLTPLGHRLNSLLRQILWPVVHQRVGVQCSAVSTLDFDLETDIPAVSVRRGGV